jgi:thioester reductase-like protein
VSVPKVRAVSGEITQPKLGMSNEDYDWLTHNCNIVLHFAGTPESVFVVQCSALFVSVCNVVCVV